MLNAFGEGLRRGVIEVVGNLASGAILSVFAASGLLSPLYVFLLSAMPAVALFFAMSKWGVLYSVGWIFGVALFATSGILSVIDLLIYLGVPLGLIGWRIWKWYDENYR